MGIANLLIFINYTTHLHLFFNKSQFFDTKNDSLNESFNSIKESKNCVLRLF